MKGGRDPMMGKRAGFSLVEVMVGLVVGTIALLALGSVMVGTSQVQRVSLSRMELSSIAETKIDQLRSHAALLTSDTVKLSVGGSLTSSVANHSEQYTSQRGRVYNVRWLVANGLNGTRDVTVRVAPASAYRNEVPYLDAQTLMLVR
jgi:prepilin-type N-terminal cleavage/methylation domain-containing protein